MPGIEASEGYWIHYELLSLNYSADAILRTLTYRIPQILGIEAQLPVPLRL